MKENQDPKRKKLWRKRKRQKPEGRKRSLQVEASGREHGKGAIPIQKAFIIWV